MINWNLPRAQVSICILSIKHPAIEAHFKHDTLHYIDQSVLGEMMAKFINFLKKMMNKQDFQM
jgi:hypothetical protein